MAENPLVVSLPNDVISDALEKAGGVPDGVELIDWPMTGPAPREHIDIVVLPYMSGLKPLSFLNGVDTRLVQSESIGFDGVASVLPAGLTYANAASVHEASTAELTLGLILALQRGIPDFVRAAEQGRWAAAVYPSLADRSVLILGYGGVGKAIEARLKAFEVSITRVASHARDEDGVHVHAVDELDALLPGADIVVVATPLTDSTRGLVDDAFLAAMSDGAMLVNIARGAVADADAILTHATSGRLRFALDVTTPEPLPQGHPLFALENVLISPHIGGATNAMMPRMARLLQRQVAHVLAGEEPENIVIRN